MGAAIKTASGDSLVFELEGGFYAIDTSDVESIVDAGKAYFLPGSSGFVNGVVGIRGEPVAIVDAAAVLTGGRSKDKKAGRKIVVLREGERAIGLDIGDSPVFFIWADGMKDRTSAVEAERHIKERAVIERNGARTVEFVDCASLFEAAKRLLSA